MSSRESITNGWYIHHGFARYAALSSYGEGSAVQLYNLIDRNRGYFDLFEIFSWTPDFRSAQDMQNFVEKGIGKDANWYTIHDGDDCVVGMFKLRRGDKSKNVASVGYCIDQDAQNYGYALRALSIGVAYGIEKLGLNVFTALIHPDNIGSQGVARKAGFVFGYTDPQFGFDKYILDARPPRVR